MSSITPLRFTGVSSFSTDFQAILDRAVQISALPIKQLQNQQGALLTKKQALGDLSSSLQDLTSAVRSLGEIGRTRALTVSSSNTTRVSVVNNGISSVNSYAITEVTSLAKAASENSAVGLATSDTTAVDSDHQLELVVGSRTFALDLSTRGNHLEGLRDAINAAGAGVSATVLNTGSNYYLSVTATAPGATTLEVRTEAGNAGTNLLTANNQGSNAVFKLNGLDVVKSDNVISDVIPGLTFTLLNKTEGDETVNLTSSAGRASLATGLTALVTAYNSTVKKVNAHIGQTAGLLSGDAIIGQVSRTLRQVIGHQGTGDVKALADFGIELDKTGTMSFNSTKFYSLSSASLEGAFTYLGSETTGFGGLSQSLDQIANPISGFIRLQQNNYDTSDIRMTSQIAELTARIERTRSVMSLKLQQADALLAGLQSQQNALETTLKSVALATFGKSG